MSINKYKKIGIIGQAVLALGLVVTLDAAGEESFFEIDATGNVNQRNVGSFKSNRHNSGAMSRGMQVTRTLPLQPYSTLKLEIPVELEYRETGNSRVEIRASQEAIDQIQFLYSGNRLTIKSMGFSTSEAVKLTLYGNDLQRVFVNSSAEVALYDIAVNDFLLSVRGAADVSVQGRARDCQVNAQGANDLDLEELVCQSVMLTAMGSSDISVNAAKSIKGRVQGAGDVEVLGNPARRKLEAMGAYDIDYQ